MIPTANSWRWSAAALVFLSSISAIVLLSNSIAPPVLIYVAVLAGGSAAVSLLLWGGTGLSARTVLLIALIGHAVALFGETVYEDDFYRFLWDGWRVVETGSAYGVPPENFFGDPSVPPAMRDVLEWVNYPELPTIYGPVLQIAFAAVHLVSGGSEFGLRILFAGAALVLSAVLLRRHSASKVALFAWNPVVTAESTIHLHPDILMALFLCLAILAGKRHPAVAGLLLAIAAGTKIVALAAWPMLLRLRPAAICAAILTLSVLYTSFAVQGHGVGMDSTQTFATQWYFNPQAYHLLDVTLGPTFGRAAALAIAGLLVLWLHARAGGFDQVPLAAIFGVILLFAPAVNAWYILWILPFALDRREIWPYVASAALPLSYLTGLNLERYDLEAFGVHPLALRAEWLLIAGAIAIDLFRKRRSLSQASRTKSSIAVPVVSVVIPALNEEGSVGASVRGILAAEVPGLSEVIVADNGSSDGTAQEAKSAGAKVVLQPERGYGAACLTALDAVDTRSNILLFMDADLSDDPDEAASILAPIIAGEAEMVIGSRRLGNVEPGAMSAPQRFGNWLAPALVRLIWGVRYTDLGPFRAIRRDSLNRLQMADRDFGWTIEMQVRAAKIQLRTAEVPVNYRKRVGVSKISGTLRGVIAAGWKILFVIGREAFGDFDGKGGKKGRNDCAVSRELPHDQSATGQST